MSDKTVLLVDDEEIICDIIASDLQEDGYKIQTAHNGHDAWKRFQEQKYDLVITDVRMPNGDGVELLDRIRKIDQHVPIVLFMTGYKDISDEEAIQRGATAILQKPFTNKILKAEIDRYLGPAGHSMA